MGAGGYVDIAADTITFAPGAPIGGVSGSSGVEDNPTGVVVLRPVTAGTAMTIGTAAPGGLTEETLVLNVRAGTLRIGSIGRAAGTVLGGVTTAEEAAAGPITISGLNLVSSSFGTSAIQTLVLETAAGGTAISQTGALFVPTLVTAVEGGGSVLLPLANGVDRIAHVARVSDGALGSQTGTYTLVSGNTLTVGSAGGIDVPLIGLRDSGATSGLPANAAIVTTGGDVTLVSQAADSIFIDDPIVASGAIVRLRSAGDISQSATGGIVAAGLLAVSQFGSVNLTAAGAINDVQTLAGTAAGDFRFINAATLTVPADGVAGDTRVPTVVGVHAGQTISSEIPSPATVELAVGSGNLVVEGPVTAPGGLVLLRRVAGASAGDIVLGSASFDAGAGSPNLVILDLTGSADLAPGNFAALRTSTTPPTGTAPIAYGPNAGGAIVLNGVSAGDTTVYLVGGAGSTMSGEGTFGLLGVYVPHSDPIALTGSVRAVNPALARTVGTPFSEPFISGTAASFFVRRDGPVVFVQTFNNCAISSQVCEVEIEIPPVMQRPPETSAVPVGTPTPILIDFAVDRSNPTPLNLTTVILVNQGNEYLFNADEDERKRRAARGGQ
jgi:hypothetical protein